MLSYLVLVVSVAYAIADPEPCSKPMILTSDTGIISAPSAAPHSNLSCVWVLQFNKDVYLWIDDFHVNTGDNLCVHNGSQAQSVIHNFTGKQDFGVLYSNAENTTIVFSSSNYSSGGSEQTFKFHYTTLACVVEAHQKSGILPSPYYVKSDGSFKCIYQIKGSDPDKVMDLTFVDFTLKKAQVSIINNNVTLATYTKSDPNPDDMILEAHNLSINIQLAKSTVEKFTVIYKQANEDCSKEMSITNPMTLLSPGNPGNYGNNLDCRWIIHSPGGTTLSLQFMELHMADISDTVIVKDGGSQFSENIGIFSIGSRTLDVYYQTSSNVTLIQFKTDQLLGASGFKLNISPQAYGQRIVNTGNFTLGIHPNHTNSSEPLTMASSPSDVVSYQFQAPQDSQVYVEFDRDAVMFPNTVIECYDGLSIVDPLIGHLTSPTAFRPVFSNGNQMLILVKGFFSNGTMTQQYLAGSFKSVLNDGTLYNSLDVAGGLSLSLMKDEYPWHATWLIHNHLAKELVSLKLDSVIVGANSTLSVYEGLSDQDLKIASISNVSTTNLPEIYISKDMEGCRVVYETSHAQPNLTETDTETETQTIFRATYTLKPDCNGNITSQRGTWTTPGFPNLYPFNAICTSTINIPEHKMAHLAFTSFDLATFHKLTLIARSYHDYNVTNETHHYRNVTERMLGAFGGRGLPNDIVTGANETEIVVTFASWSSDSITVASGVNLTYDIIDCGGNLTSVNGSFMNAVSHNKTLNNTSTCVWIISLPNTTKHNDSVNIVSFTYDLQGETGSVSSLDIRDGLSSSAEGIPLNASNSAKNPILSRTNALWVKYTFQAGKKDAVNKSSFQLNYTTYECPKSQQCNNSICMHEDWKCNGRDDCGDGSDEDGCRYNHKGGKQGYAGWALGVAIVATFIIAVIATFAAQAIYKRCRYQNYDELRDLMAPVPT